jgi:hypothetical protein
MSTADREGPAREPAERTYALCCLGGVLVILLALSQRGLHTGSMIPVLIGVAGVAFRWRTAPVLLIVALVFEYLGLWRVMMFLALRYWGLAGTFWRTGASYPSDGLVNCLLGIGVLIYVSAQYRLQGLTIHIVPPDPRRARRPNRRLLPSTATAPIRRSSASVSVVEIALLLATAPIWAVLASLVWELLPQHWYELGLPPALWRTLILAWSIGVGLLVTGSLLAQLGRQRMSRAEAVLLLQDVLWRETRREQRRINRWLAWIRIRRQRREEKE